MRNPTAFAAELRGIRNSLKLTQIRFSAKVGVAQGSLNGWENYNLPDHVRMARLVEGLKKAQVPEERIRRLQDLWSQARVRKVNLGAVAHGHQTVHNLTKNVPEGDLSMNNGQTGTSGAKPGVVNTNNAQGQNTGVFKIFYTLGLAFSNMTDTEATETITQLNELLTTTSGLTPEKRKLLWSAVGSVAKAVK